MGLTSEIRRGATGRCKKPKRPLPRRLDLIVVHEFIIMSISAQRIIDLNNSINSLLTLRDQIAHEALRQR
jgi:hypothetical protein